MATENSTNNGVSSEFPYPSMAGIRFKINEPMSYAYFNAHTLRLLQNIRSLNRTVTPQKATERQWGVTKFATVDDIITDGGNRDLAFTNATMAQAIKTLESQNLLRYQTEGKLPMSKSYEWTHGEFVVGLNEHTARKVTNNPGLVAYYHVYFTPLDCKNDIMYTVRSAKTDADGFRNFTRSSDMINFGEWQKPANYNAFHVYYHKDGYVICSNEQIDPGQRQIRVCYDLLSRK